VPIIGHVRHVGYAPDRALPSPRLNDRTPSAGTVTLSSSEGEQASRQEEPGDYVQGMVYMY